MAFREDYADQINSEEVAKNRAFNNLRTEFSRQMLKRFHEIKGNVEDIWDMANNKALIAGRLATIAEKDPTTWTENNLKDMALIACILWNDVE